MKTSNPSFDYGSGVEYLRVGSHRVGSHVGGDPDDIKNMQEQLEKAQEVDSYAKLALYLIIGAAIIIPLFMSINIGP
ncbi:MAG: hypothetical protein ACPGVT_05220 [Maricaulaceae bacterium]